jgi:hypothetical protein
MGSSAEGESSSNLFGFIGQALTKREFGRRADIWVTSGARIFDPRRSR